MQDRVMQDRGGGVCLSGDSVLHNLPDFHLARQPGPAGEQAWLGAGPPWLAALAQACITCKISTEGGNLVSYAIRGGGGQISESLCRDLA